MKKFKNILAVFFLFTIFSSNFSFAQKPDGLTAYNEPPSRLRGVIEKFSEDYGTLNRLNTAPTSPNRSTKFSELYAERLAYLAKLDFNLLNSDEQVDYLLFKNYLEHEQKELSRFQAQLEEMAPLIPSPRLSATSKIPAAALESVDPAKIAAC